MNEDIKRKVLSSKIEIAYTDKGLKSKPTILFIHGLANYHAVWDWNTEILQQHFRCICIDLPGNGESGRGDNAYTIDFYANTIIDFALEMNLGIVTLAGHSMGGMIAIKIALSKKIKLNKLLLFAPAGFEYYTTQESILFKSAITMGNFLNLDEAQVAQSVRTSFYKQNKNTEKIINDLTHIIQTNDRTQYRSMLERSINSMLDEQTFHELKNITEKTLVFFGEDDMLIPNRFLHPGSTKEVAKKAIEQMPQGKLVTYSKTGHFVQIERAKEVNDEIISFLKK